MLVWKSFVPLALMVNMCSFVTQRINRLASQGFVFVYQTDPNPSGGDDISALESTIYV